MSYDGPGARGPATGPVALAPEAEGVRYVRWPWRVWMNNSVGIGAGAKDDGRPDRTAVCARDEASKIEKASRPDDNSSDSDGLARPTGKAVRD